VPYSRLQSQEKVAIAPGDETIRARVANDGEGHEVTEAQKGSPRVVKLGDHIVTHDKDDGFKREIEGIRKLRERVWEANVITRTSLGGTRATISPSTVLRV
jgi:hypothetical protein